MKRMSNNEQVIMNCLKKVLHNVEFDHESNLLDLGIDSMTFIRLVVEIEDEFDIEIEDEEIVLQNFESVESIVKLVERNL
ncbi:acyl carrier protein [Fictibacillus solisalsi]|uniref:Acyl carrier protein n=1 Tax=Fictibacillus solisalsi TaxID=459525 RepID=A0A1H0BT58_9BACL|nr:acyl carrier protein [Fictibacillus solisalsi]SDN48756.1 acyl carrier protein [Fictibacillus solisalsi]